jgi:hypothetical protein
LRFEAGGRPIASLGQQQPLQERGFNHAPEADLAIDRHDRHLGVIKRDQVGIGVDIDLVDRNPEPPLSGLEQIEGLVAAAALRAGVDGDIQMFEAGRAVE